MPVGIYPRPSAEQRFWQKVLITPDCWIWTGTKAGNCYGSFWFNEKHVYAHRWIYEQENGAIPSGYYLCHSCDNPPCVNPQHLWVGTPSQNQYDCAWKGRKPKRHKVQPTCGKGHPRPGNRYKNGQCRPCNGLRYLRRREKARGLQ